MTTPGTAPVTAPVTASVEAGDPAGAPAAPQVRATEAGGPTSRRLVAAWEITGFLVILGVGSFLHFIYELSGFAAPAAVFGSVNESTWEHLKLFYWPGLAFAVVQHAYLRHRVNNFWWAKGVSLLLVTLLEIVAFYCYVGIVVPIEGKGTLAGTIVTACIAIGLAQLASYRLLTGAPVAAWTRRAGIAIVWVLGALMVLFTYAPPHIFLFENFFGYRYTGEFGILRDYTPYLVFK
jgi:hypothetical protein